MSAHKAYARIAVVSTVVRVYDGSVVVTDADTVAE